jgi:hypothetical protein
LGSRPLSGLARSPPGGCGPGFWTGRLVLLAGKGIGSWPRRLALLVPAEVAVLPGCWGSPALGPGGPRKALSGPGPGSELELELESDARAVATTRRRLRAGAAETPSPPGLGAAGANLKWKPAHDRTGSPQARAAPAPGRKLSSGRRGWQCPSVTRRKWVLTRLGNSPADPGRAGLLA